MDRPIEAVSPEATGIISMPSIGEPFICIASCDGIASCDDAESRFICFEQQAGTRMFAQSAAASALLQPLNSSASSMMPINEMTRRIAQERGTDLPDYYFSFVNRESSIQPS